MSLFFETICIVQTKALRLPYHQKRVHSSLQHIKATLNIDLHKVLSQFDLTAYQKRTRCRIDYGPTGVTQVQFLPYVPRKVEKLRLVHTHMDYAQKRCDRSELDALFAQRGDADDVLLVKEGLLTDSTIANIALQIGQSWYTPEKPLLAGTHRAALIEAGLLIPAPLRVADLQATKTIRLFNAMLQWGEIELKCSPDQVKVF